MALITCPDCSNNVSDAAPACPHCGRPLQLPSMEPLAITQLAALEKPSAGRGRRHLLIIVGLLAIVVIALRSLGASNNPAPPDSRATESAKTPNAIEQASDQALQAVEAIPAAEPTPPPILVMTPIDMLRRYESNEVAADQYFAGKLIKVTAPVKSIDKDFSDSVVLHFSTGIPFYDFDATMDDSQKTRAADLTRGQEVTVTCVSMRRIMRSPVGGGCVLQ